MAALRGTLDTMRSAPNNLTRLHQQEEAIRTWSLDAVSKNGSLSDHLQALHDALDHLTLLVHVESKPGDRLHTVQLLAMRLFNCGGSSLKLGLSGYYQAAFQLLRDSLELVNLVDLFRIDADAIDRWKDADDKTLKKEFAPVHVRRRLEAHPDFAGQRRELVYSTFSGYAAHPSYKGFMLIAPGNRPRLGPFFDGGLLLALLGDLSKHIAHAALGVSLLLETRDIGVLRGKAEYLKKLRGYHDQYLKQGAP